MWKVLNLAMLGAMMFGLFTGCTGKRIETLKEAVCCDGGYEYRNRNKLDASKAADDLGARNAALEKERRRLSDDLAASQTDNGALTNRVNALEGQMADRDRELNSLRSSAGDSSRMQSDLDQARSRNADLERQLAAASGDKDRLASDLAGAQSGLGDKERLAAELAAAQSQVALLQAGGADKEKCASELAAAKQRITELESQLASAQGAGADKDRLSAELASTKQRVADLEKQLAGREQDLAARDKELAGLRGDLSTEMSKLREAQRGLVRALRPQIDKNNIAVDLNNERLLINLASGYLFGSGEDELKPAGAEALKQVGAILKEYPEYKVAVEGHTDNRPIRSSLKKRFPSNQELSEARAANAAKALGEGGLPGAATSGYADSRPVGPNSTDAGRAQNRRVEIRVTK
ncbi:putative Outer membrane protein, OmpA/MotB family [Nitrospira sp. KM1]|uniref:OmpA family protein n=1 Tax=Nitrospira sp. KM1 TaxID=1936990 RepID=UPI0013A73AA6|nr:OmpA family protein [Nitrospira sp. KM1]BCA55417.1 putative Outer membrane protein, OmpA/MotB family [Nitrospira sp. KM1]